MLPSVYVMERGDGALKIGHSRKPARRSGELGRIPILFVGTARDDAERVEKLAHRVLTLAGRRVRGQREWFWTTLADAEAAIARAERIVAGLEPEPSKPPRQSDPNFELVTIALPRAMITAIDFHRGKLCDAPSRSQFIRELIAKGLEA